MPRTHLLALSVAAATATLIALAPATARADYYGSDEPWQKHLEFQLGFSLGGQEVGTFDDGFVAGGDLSLLVPLTRKLALRGEGRLQGLSQTGYGIENPIGGVQERLGLAVRYRFW